MKNLSLLLLALLFLTSCEMTEKVYFYEDNTVKYAYDLDLTQISPILGVDIGDKMVDNFPVDTVMSVHDFVTSDILGDNKRDTENTDHMDKIFKDFDVHFKMNKESGFFSFFTKQKDVHQLNKVLNEMHQNMAEVAAENAEKDTDKFDQMFSKMFQNSVYAYDGKNFSRSGKIDMSFVEEMMDDEESMGMMAMFGIMSYKSEYHFPRPVKSISDTSVLMSWDRKTIYLEKPLNELMKDQNAYNFSLVLED